MFRNHHSFKVLLGWVLVVTASAHSSSVEQVWVVLDGNAETVSSGKEEWRTAENGLYCEDTRAHLQAGRVVDTGDFEVFFRLMVHGPQCENGAILINAEGHISDSEFIFNRQGHIYVRGFFFGDRTQRVRPVKGLNQPEKWFEFRIRRKGDVVSFIINDAVVWETIFASDRPLGKLELKPAKSGMTVESFVIQGKTKPIDEWTPRTKINFPVNGKYSTDVYKAGAHGYHTYRIPAIIKTKSRTLLAFAEGRKNSHHDHGDVDLVVCRSTDKGRSWSTPQLVYEEGGTARTTIGNPSPVVDNATGVIWLFFCRDNQHVLVIKSEDEGETWDTPRDLTAALKKPEWLSWYATGPCHGIQLASGRLVIPANHGFRDVNKVKTTRSHLILSDDNGASWYIGGITEPGTNESTVAEVAPGQLYFNRRTGENSYARVVARSINGGLSFGESHLDTQLVDPTCQGSVLSFAAGDTEPLLVFSNAASQRREYMTVRSSQDAGNTWSGGFRVYDGSAAYSDLVQIDENTVGVLFEREHYDAITFVSLDRTDFIP